MISIYLHGELGRHVGEKWDLAVDSVAEAIRAIDANTGKLYEYLSAEDRLSAPYQVIVDDEDVGEEELQTKKPTKEIHIMPSVTGSKFLKKAFKVILGVALIVASFFIPGAWAAAAPWLSSMMVSVGISLVMQGITELMSKPPKIGEATQTQGFLMGGNVNNAAQGQAVPIGYGRLRVGSQVISVAMRNRLKDSISYEAAITSHRLKSWKRVAVDWTQQTYNEYVEMLDNKALHPIIWKEGYNEGSMFGGVGDVQSGVITLNEYRSKVVPDFAREQWENARLNNGKDRRGRNLLENNVYDADTLFNNIPAGFNEDYY